MRTHKLLNEIRARSYLTCTQSFQSGHCREGSHLSAGAGISVAHVHAHKCTHTHAMWLAENQLFLSTSHHYGLTTANPP